jgi:hypothetical protein
MFGRRFGPPFFGGGWGWQYGHGPGRDWFSPEQMALRSTAGEVARLFMIASRSAVDNPERQAQLRDFLERSRKELADIIYGSGQSSEKGSSTSGPGVEQA